MNQILVVDDNETVARALGHLLVREGFAAIVCVTGRAALDATETAAPAAAVVDIHLPDISGLVLTQQLRERLGPNTPIIIVSGDTSQGLLNSLPHVGATYFFPKPISGQRLIERIRELLAAQTDPDRPVVSRVCDPASP